MSAKSTMSQISDKRPTTHLNVKFEKNPRGIFHPNDVINGIVELNVERRIKRAKGLKLIISGVASCSWKKGKKVFEGHHTILDYVNFFFGKADGEPIVVSIGVHLYKFTCQIPAIAVSSYNGTYGGVKYIVKATLEIPKSHNIEFEMPFTVYRIENLNDFPWLRKEITTEAEHGIGNFCFDQSPFLISLRISKSGFTLGEKITARIEIRNEGQAKFLNPILSLDRLEVCNSSIPEQNSITSRKIITYCNTKDIKPFESLKYEESIIIPEELSVTSDKMCDVFKVSYQLKYSAKSNKRKTVEVFVPITLGHVRLTEEIDLRILQRPEAPKTVEMPNVVEISDAVEKPTKNGKSEKFINLPSAPPRPETPHPSKWTFVL